MSAVPAFSNRRYPPGSRWLGQWVGFGVVTVVGCTTLGATVLSFDVVLDDGSTGRAWPAEIVRLPPAPPALRLLQGGRA